MGYLRETKSKQKRNPKGAIPVFGFKISVQNNSGLVEELRALRTTEPSPQSPGLVLTLNLGCVTEPGSEPSELWGVRGKEKQVAVGSRMEDLPGHEWEVEKLNPKEDLHVLERRGLHEEQGRHGELGCTPKRRASLGFPKYKIFCLKFCFI